MCQQFKDGEVPLSAFSKDKSNAHLVKQVIWLKHRYACSRLEIGFLIKSPTIYIKIVFTGSLFHAQHTLLHSQQNNVTQP